MKRLLYRGYKLEKSPREDWGWNVYISYGRGGGSWYWLWAYGSLDEAKAAIDEHLDGNMEG